MTGRLRTRLILLSLLLVIAVGMAGVLMAQSRPDPGRSGNSSTTSDADRSQPDESQPETNGDGDSAAPTEDLEPEPSDPKGPTGRWPNRTPAYDSPADAVVELPELPEALDQASPGDVIEVEAQTYELSSPLVIDRCTDGDRLLVRPPLGERGEVVIGGREDILFDEACNIAMAGLVFAGGTTLRMEGASYVALAWIEWEDSASSVIRGSKDIDLVEHVRREMTTTQRSALHLIRNSGSVGSERVRLVGWWHAGMWRESGESNQAKDTLQTFHLDGGIIKDVHIIDSVLFASSDKVMQNHDNQLRGFKVINTWMNRPNDPWWDVPDGYTTHGSYGHVSISGIGADAVFDRTTIVGNVSEARSGHSSGVARDNLIRSTNLIGSVLQDKGGNAIDEAINVSSTPPPPLPDLDTVWHS